MNRKYRTKLSGFLIRPSFVVGMARVFDLGTGIRFFEYRKSSSETDVKAMQGDWKIIGKDISYATEEYARYSRPTQS